MRIPVIDPATGAEVASIADANRADVDKAVAAARKAFEGTWARMLPADREALIWRLADLIDQHADVILKPLDGMGGQSIFRVTDNDANRNVIIETLSAQGTRSIMAQRYIPEIHEGDKRILLIAGKPVPFSLARIPKAGESRGNLAAGGTGVARPLSQRDLQIANALGPVLAQRGLLLVGLDVIGDYLTEVNCTSPTCFREITDQTGFNVAGMFMDALESACAGGK